MTRLSLAIVVKDEEESLPRCLESVQGIVDEMVVLDTGSSDRTVEIAKDLGAKVEFFEWVDDFAIARNYGLEFVTGEWVLVLDADEVLVPEAVEPLLSAIADPDNLVVNLIRQEVGAVQSPYSLVSRVFRNHPDVKFTRPYHSLVDDTVAELQAKEPHWKIADLPQVGMLHYGYSPKAIAALNKTERAKRAMEKFYNEHPTDPYVCAKLGAIYLQLDRREEGLKLLETGLINADKNPHLIYELNYHLGNAYRSQDPNGAVNYYQMALKQKLLPPLKLGAYNNLGSLLVAGQEHEMAVQAYDQVLKIDPTFAIGYYNKGLALRGIGDFKGAIAAYQKTIELVPDYPWAYQNWGVALLKLGQVDESYEKFERAITLHDAQNNPQEAQRLRDGLRSMGWKGNV
ncbi:MAG: glycosyltransferase [Cyanobacteria bacterium P01_H01_bin.15]